MAFFGNLLWFVFGGGFFAWVTWMFLGLLLCCTVVGIPFGMAAFRIAGFAAFPFGRELVDAQLLGEKRICGTGLANVLWIILAGLWLAIAHVLAAISCFLAFILVFPVFFGFAHVKLAGVCFAPLGKRPVSREVAEEARMRGARAEINQRLRK
ncbi:MAG TPA: YccF domain-containing protein [Kiritimatiellia bacterium]|jgi:uncharacterized membrane protein YccF (DUF307 family)|nr:MAG: Inner membrane protein YccF [Verrucomicrobia bacterium ADurb.Bin070]HQL50489.1 YccF domain-containing protein [Kiritimatiellia bacterium]HQQ92408.1 YccF domain-containing protein [Kiritimatiellia bacterium]